MPSFLTSTLDLSFNLISSLTFKLFEMGWTAHIVHIELYMYSPMTRLGPSHLRRLWPMLYMRLYNKYNPFEIWITLSKQNQVLTCFTRQFCYKYKNSLTEFLQKDSFFINFWYNKYRKYTIQMLSTQDLYHFCQ